MQHLSEIHIAYWSVFQLIGFAFARKLPNRIGSGILFGLLGVIISLSRATLETGDLPNYAAGFSSFTYNAYFLREPLFWFVGKLTYSLVQDPRYTFLIIDTILLLLFRSSLHHHSGFVIFFFLITFPFILGFTNIYRQLFASFLLMKAFSVNFEGKKIGHIYFVMAALCHIATIPLISSYYAMAMYRKFPAATFIISAAALGIFISIGEFIRILNMIGGTGTINNTAPIYVILFFTQLIVTSAMIGKKNPQVRDTLWATLLYGCFGIYLLTIVPPSSGTRILMISITIVGYTLIYHRGQISLTQFQRNLFLYTYLFVLIIPSVISPSAWHLIWQYKL